MAYFKNEKVKPIDQPNFSHNLHFWAVSLAENGDYEEAIKVAKILAGVLNESKRENTTKSQNIYTAATLESFIEIRFNHFKKASKALAAIQTVKDSGLDLYLKFLSNYCSMMEEVQKEQGDWDVVFTHIEEMKSGLKEFQTARGKEKINQRENQKAVYVMELLVSSSKVYQFNLESGKKLDLEWVEFLLADEAKLPYTEPPLLPTVMAEDVADLCMAKGKPKLAIGYFEKALEKRPKSIPVYRKLLAAYQQTGNTEKATDIERLITR